LPAFFAEVPKLRLRDPLAELLGCAEDGVLEYSYADAVRLTGHSCPTVAAAYWLTWLALAELYPRSLPQRGGIKVELRDDARTGSTGVVAAVIQMLTGAAGGSGFKGIQGMHARAGLQRFMPGLPLSLRFTRLDTGEAVDAAVDLSMAPEDPALAPALAGAVIGSTSDEERRSLGEAWQERVRHLLLDLARNRGVFIIRRVERGAAPLALPSVRYVPDHARSVVPNRRF
jgi:hypothetical protein